MTARRLSFAVAAAFAGLIAACAPVISPESSDPPVEYQHVGIGKGTGSVSLAVVEKGRGKPVILLHGLGASSFTWRHVQAGLARSHRVIAIDLKGFGQSDKPLDERYSIADQAALIWDYIKEKDLRGVTVVGHSFGGAVALMTALDQVGSGERRIERLVLVDSVAYRQPMPFFFQMLRTPVIGELGMELVPPELQISQALAIAYYNKGKVDDETVANYAAPLHSEGGRHALFHTINSLEPDKAEFVTARYRELKLPSLLLWCEHDHIVPLEFGKKLAQDLPNARIEIIGNCGHIPQEEQPTATLRAIERFMQ